MTQEDKKIITDELNRRLKQLWLSSSTQADNDDYYRNPLVKQLKELAVFVSDIKVSEKPMDQEELEEEMDRYFETMPVFEHENIFEETFKSIAIHFYDLGQRRAAEWNREDEQNLNVCLSYIKDESLRSWLIDAIHVRYDKPSGSERK